jgi:hypothetical protein
MSIEMNIKPYIIILLAIGTSFVGFSQDNLPANNDNKAWASNASPGNAVKAEFEINDVKNRGIIVRLKTNKDRIDQYRKAGYKKVADELEQESKMLNLRLEMAFITRWTYCPVYFMESQNTRSLMLNDSLVMKTADLERDTVIYMNKDSFYLIDFGVLLGNQVEPTGKYRSEQTGSPASDQCLVVKDHDLMQVQYPFPYFTKVLAIDIDNGPQMKGFNEGARFDYSSFGRHARADMTREERDTLNRFLDASYDYIETYHSKNKFQKSVMRLNARFIDYYCKRLDKDKGVILNDDPIYWWHRNPNIPYLQALSRIEEQLKSYTAKDQKFTRTN